nr:hypothetical protein [Nocardia cyriacigeorgica]
MAAQDLRQSRPRMSHWRQGVSGKKRDRVVGLLVIDPGGAEQVGNFPVARASGRSMNEADSDRNYCPPRRLDDTPSHHTSGEFTYRSGQLGLQIARPVPNDNQISVHANLEAFPVGIGENCEIGCAVAQSIEDRKASGQEVIPHAQHPGDSTARQLDAHRSPPAGLDQILPEQCRGSGCDPVSVVTESLRAGPRDDGAAVTR